MSPTLSIITVVGAILVSLVGYAGAAPGSQPDFPAGLGLDEKLEGQLGDALVDLVRQIDVGPLDLATLHVAPNKADLPGLIGKIAAARQPVGQLWKLADPAASQPSEPVALPQAPYVLLGGSARVQVQALWLAQLRINVLAADGLFRGQRATLGEWAEASAGRDLKKRAGPIAMALREADRATRLLLMSAAGTVTVKPGPELFADDFSKGAENWLAFGNVKTVNEKDAFRFIDTSPQHPDAMLWTKKEFDGNFIAEFTFVPHSTGARAGALFTICGQPRPGEKLSVCVGDSMDTYNYGIDGYHFSMHRGNTGLGNVRRVGPGLKMLASGPDPCPKIEQEYRVSVAKWGPTIMLLVDGNLIHHYVDAGTYGPVLNAGRIGLRHWAGMDGSYRDFRVCRLEAGR